MSDYLLVKQHQDTAQEVSEVLILHQLTYEFKQETTFRQDFEAHCQRYYELSKQNQREHATMQLELDLFSLFRRMIGID